MQNVTLGNQLVLAVPAFAGCAISLYLMAVFVEGGEPLYNLLHSMLEFLPAGGFAADMVGVLIVCLLCIPGALGILKTLDS